jgi:hypothetical protein
MRLAVREFDFAATVPLRVGRHDLRTKIKPFEKCEKP